MLHDSWGYWRIAFNLELHHVFSQSTGDSIIHDSLRTPFYPLLIVFFNKLVLGFWGIIVFQILVSAMTCSLVYLLSDKIFENKKAALAAGLFLAFDFPSVFFSNTLLTETIFTALILLSAYFLISFSLQKNNRLIYFSALLLGLAILCRPIAFYMPFLFAVVMAFSKIDIVKPSKLPVILWPRFERRWPAIKAALILSIVSCLVVIPWMSRNKIVFGSAFLSSVDEVSLLMYTTAGIRSEKESKPVAQIQQEYRDYSIKYFDWNKRETTTKYMKYCRQESWTVISNNPMLFFKRQAIAMVYFFIKPLRNYIDMQLGKTHQYESAEELDMATLATKTSGLTVAMVILQGMMLVAIGVLLLTFFIRKELNFPVMIMAAIVIYLAAMSVFTEVDARLRVPAMPFLCALAGAGWSVFHQLLRRSFR